MKILRITELPAAFTRTPQLTQNGLSLEWNLVGFTLQKTADLAKPLWQDIPGSESQISMEVPMDSDQGFFRLLKDEP